MLTYKYSLIAKMIYRYGNFPITFFLLIYLVESIIQIQNNWYFIFFGILNIVILISLNRYYIKSYRIFPSHIIANNQKMICSKYFLSNKTIEIEYSQIKRIYGGIFSGNPTRPVYILDEKGKILLGFYSHVGNFSRLLETILKNIDEGLYQQLLSNMKNLK